MTVLSPAPYGQSLELPDACRRPAALHQAHLRACFAQCLVGTVGAATAASMVPSHVLGVAVL